ncbi:hypothetical protein C2S53_000905 [Perilla frutescens var. hirtella]|uniref:Uncharacterized protein n=1 Tax=Perilla frutescens var. hirtella TaxID=608512 RepID=A0AAD4PD69_PERFH|nr:hypothetical protein C2S53_000905 [Perilla frutescens var. hirtella]
MDLLSKAYATASDSDDDGGGNHGGGVTEHWNPLPPPPKRLRPETLSANPIQMPSFRPLPSHNVETPIPGGYISKRQRAAVSDPKQTAPNPNYVAPSPGNSRPWLI